MCGKNIEKKITKKRFEVKILKCIWSKYYSSPQKTSKKWDA